MRRIGFGLFALAGLSIVIAVVSIAYASGAPTDLRSRALGYGLVNVAFAVVNVMLGLVLLIGSRERL